MVVVIVTGHFETNKLWVFRFKDKPQNHVTRLDVAEKDEKEVLDQMRSEFMQVGKKEPLVFIHSYNQGFADAARRTAQLANDLPFQGQAIFYSWPSEDNSALYDVDWQNVQITFDPFEHFLKAVLEKSGLSGSGKLWDSGSLRGS